MGYEERTGEQGMMSFKGLDISMSELMIEAGKSPDLLNVDLHPIGSLKDRSGFEVKSTVGTTGLGMLLHQARSDLDVELLYAHRGGGLFRANSISSAWVATTALISNTRRANLINSYYNGSSCVLICDGENKPQIATMDPTIADDVIDWPAGVYGDSNPGTGTPGYPAVWTTGVWPRFMAMVNMGLGADAHRSMAWGFSDDKYRVDYSELGVATNYLEQDVDAAITEAQPEVDGGSFFVGRGDHDDIVDIVGMFGYMVVFKKKRIYILQGDPGDANFGVTHVFPVGALSRRSIIRFGNDIAFWSDSGPRVLSSVQEHGDLQERNIGREVQGVIDSISSGRHDEIVCINDLDNNRLMWFAPTNGASSNNKALVFYYDQPRWTVWDGSITEMTDVIRIGRDIGADQHIYGLGYDGVVSELAVGNLDGEEVIESYYYTHWFNFGTITDGARQMWLDILYGDNGDAGLTIEYQKNLVGRLRETEPPMKSYGADGFRWDDDNAAWDDEDIAWDETSKAYNRLPIPELSNLFRIKFTGSGDGRFEILGYRIESRQKGSRV